MVSAPVTVEGKTAVVIGGTRGIGRAIALGFAEDGADVVATSRSRDAVENIAAELRERGAATTEITCDVTKTEDVEALRDTVIEDVGEVDVLVNSAGTVAMTPVTEMTDEEWQRDIDVDLTGVFKACRAFGQTMTEGSIINISSMSAYQARKARAAYCASKSGINGLTRAVSADLAPEIRVNAIAPGFVKTEMAGPKLDDGSDFRATVDERTPMGRVATPDEMVGTAIYLASDAASFTTGEVITVDGGYDDSAQ